MKTNDEIYNEIKGKFDECPDLPESLSKENVVAMLNGTEQEKTSTITFKKIGSYAAVFVLAVLCALTANFAFGDIVRANIQQAEDKPTQQIAVSPTLNNEMKPEVLPEGIRKAQSRDEIEKIVLKNYSAYKDIYLLFDAAVDMNTATGSAPETAPGAAMNTDTDNLKGYGETNTQTKGVDEADIIKNDGRYLYVLGYDLSNNRKLRIIDTETMTVVYNGYIYNDNGDILYLNEIYVSGNTLVAIGTYGNNYYSYGFFVDSIYGSAGGKTVTVVMDITDRANPKTLRKIEQDGSYRSSRMVGSVIYTLTEYTVTGKNEDEAKTNSVPEVGGTEIKCDCIYITDEHASRYICLTAYDTATADSEVTSLAVLGNGNEIYCSPNNLYVIGTKHINRKENDNVDIDTYTVINAFSLNGTSITFSAQGEVPGYINNQYSLDEYDGKLRIATTAYSSLDREDKCSLYVLDKELKTIGKVENIAENEQIKSVRYMGNTAYVVTFRNTDPLFVIDLQNPKEPVIKGELKLPGYSAYMHPVSESIVLGIGYNGDTQNADFTSLKISLFDVSDMSAPKEISTLTYDNCCSRITDDPKAFIYNMQESYIALPVEIYGKYELSGYGCYIISIENNDLTLKHKLEHKVEDVYSGISFIRGTYINDNFFTISDNLTVKHSLKNGKSLGECRIYEEGKVLQATTVTVNEDKGADFSQEVTVTSPPYNPNN